MKLLSYFQSLLVGSICMYEVLSACVKGPRDARGKSLSGRRGAEVSKQGPPLPCNLSPPHQSVLPRLLERQLA